MKFAEAIEAPLFNGNRWAITSLIQSGGFYWRLYGTHTNRDVKKNVTYFEQPFNVAPFSKNRSILYCRECVEATQDDIDSLRALDDSNPTSTNAQVRHKSHC